jgi:hypothetical protein
MLLVGISGDRMRASAETFWRAVFFLRPVTKRLPKRKKFALEGRELGMGNQLSMHDRLRTDPITP